MSDFVLACPSCNSTFYVMSVDEAPQHSGSYCCFCGSDKVVGIDDVEFRNRPVLTVLDGGKAKPPEERPGVSSDTKEGNKEHA